MQFPDYANQIPGWAQTDDPLRVIFSTKIKIVRNIVGFSFPIHLSNDAKLEVRQHILDAIKNVKSIIKPQIYHLENLTEQERLFLAERHHIPRSFPFGNIIGKSVIFSEDETVSICINDSDHLQLYTQLPDNSADKAFFNAGIILEELGKYLDFAFDKQLGYLTSKLSDTGTGMHISQIFHTPILELENQLGRVKRSAKQVGFLFTAYNLPNTSNSTGYYKLISMKTLGINEILQKNQISILSEKLVEYEQKMRGISFVERKSFLKDKSWRAFGIFKTARIISGKETIRLLSDLLLAVSLKIIENLDPNLIIKLLFQIQQGHLSIILNKKHSTDEIDKVRAEFIRKLIQDS